jgi:eukaryotic-like serine/threonine-protein kinase
MKVCPICSLKYPDATEHCAVHPQETLASYIDPRLGSIIASRFEILEAIGEGGMATVYRAKQLPDGRAVAVKILNRTLRNDPRLVERFRRESRHVARIAHPNIIQIFESGDTEDGSAFLAMELCTGRTLATLLEEERKCELNQALSIMIQICRGIGRAHDLGVIHRDLKPENIFLVRGLQLSGDLAGTGDIEPLSTEIVKILDFGIARSKADTRLTGTGEIFGTPQYMSPQRISGDDPTGSDDIYSLGIIFFELLTGQLPFTAKDVASIFMQHLRQAPRSPREVNPAVPDSVQKLVLRMLAKKVEERPVDAHAIEAELMVLSTARAVELPAGEIDPSSEVRTQTTDVLPSVWEERSASLQAMVVQAFGDPVLAPSTVEKNHARLSDLLTTYGRQFSAVSLAQREIAQLDLREREQRVQIGKAVAALGNDLSRTKGELQELIAQRASSAAETHQKAFLRALDHVQTEEGKSGLRFPSKNLAEAYRSVADVVDAWLAFREAQMDLPERVAEKERQASDIEFQLETLRKALADDEDRSLNVRRKHNLSLGEATRLLEAVDQELRLTEQAILQALSVHPELAVAIGKHRKFLRKSGRASLLSLHPTSNPPSSESNRKLELEGENATKLETTQSDTGDDKPDKRTTSPATGVLETTQASPLLEQTAVPETQDGE